MKGTHTFHHTEFDCASPGVICVKKKGLGDQPKQHPCHINGPWRRRVGKSCSSAVHLRNAQHSNITGTHARALRSTLSVPVQGDLSSSSVRCKVTHSSNSFHQKIGTLPFLHLRANTLNNVSPSHTTISHLSEVSFHPDSIVQKNTVYRSLKTHKKNCQHTPSRAAFPDSLATEATSISAAPLSSAAASPPSSGFSDDHQLLNIVDV